MFIEDCDFRREDMHVELVTVCRGVPNTPLDVFSGNKQLSFISIRQGDLMTTKENSNL